MKLSATTLRFTLLEVIAVLSGAIIGKLVFDGVSALFFDTSFFDLFASIGRWIVAFATVILFSILYQKLPATPAALACLLVGTLITWTFFGLAFESQQSSSVLVFMTFLFSAVALLTYRFVHANAAVRQVANDMSGAADAPDRAVSEEDDHGKGSGRGPGKHGKG